MKLKKKTGLLKKMQADTRVGRRRALQILAGEEESPRSKPQSYPTHLTFHMQNRPGKETNIQPMRNRKEPHPRNWKQTRHQKIKQRIRIYHRNLKRKKKQNSPNYNVTRLSTILRKGQSGISRLRQNQPKPRPDLYPRL